MAIPSVSHPLLVYRPSTIAETVHPVVCVLPAYLEVVSPALIIMLMRLFGAAS